MVEVTNNKQFLSLQRTDNDLRTHPSDIFASLLNDRSAIGGALEEFYTDGPLRDDGPFEFSLPINGRKEYTDTCRYIHSALILPFSHL
jgi:hypothetical protein